MSVQFVIGGSGSGKTEYLYSSLTAQAQANPRGTYIVLVPEQFTLQTQRKLVELSAHGAIMNVDVLSFQRLAYRVFDDLGIRAMQILEETGKNLALRRVAQEQQEHLTAIRPNLGRMGYISELKSLLSELMQYRISCEQLEEFIATHTISPALAGKLKDVAVLYRAFSDFIHTQYRTAEEILPMLVDLADRSELLRGAVIAFDEYTGFTPAQYELITKLMPLTQKMIFTLTMDAREDFYRTKGEHELFAMPKETLRLISDAAMRQHIAVEQPVVLNGAQNKRYAQAPEIYFMEQNLFRTTGKKWQGISKEANSSIIITAYQNPKEELTAVARQICRLVQQEGIRYQQIAVVSGDVQTYARFVPEIFEKYHIPYFLDATKDILFHPFTELIRAAVEVVHRDFSYEAVMRFLRCGFLDMEAFDIDRLDNYLLATGIHGYRMWSNRFLRRTPDMKEGDTLPLEQMDALRQQVMAVLEPFYAVFHRSKATVEERLYALYELLAAMDAEHKLAARGEAYLAADEQAKAMEYGQIYRIVMELFDRYTGIMGQDVLTLQEFSELLDAGLDAAQVASLPPGYDSVTVGDIERTRLNEIKILFFLGVNDGIIPASETAGGVLSQFEREQLREADLPLAPGARERTFEQRYYLYLSMTKPSQRLYVSYVRVDMDGKAVKPSYLIGVLERMFPDMAVGECANIYAEADLDTEAAAWDYFIHGEKNHDWELVANYFLFHAAEPQRKNTKVLLAAGGAHYTPDPIAEPVAAALYGNRLLGSVTRLEQYASCAYAHFLKYGLLLRERLVSGFGGADIGSIYHDALARYSQNLRDANLSWFTISDTKRQEMAQAAFDESLAQYDNLAFRDTAGDTYFTRRMADIFQETVWALTRQVRAGQFKPQEFEINFHVHGASNQLELRGRIDRIDLCEADGQLFVKIIDYKSGSQKFDLSKIYQGTQLQLMLYLDAGLSLVRKTRHQPTEPAGVLYYHIDEPVVEDADGMTEEELREAFLRKLRPEGLVNADQALIRSMDADLVMGSSTVIPVTLTKDGRCNPRGSSVATSEEFGILCDYVNFFTEESAGKILHGDIAVNPYRSQTEGSCTYCPYAAVCGLDPKIPGYGYRAMPKGTREEILDKMSTDVALHKIR